jgi:pyruvyltransferase
MGDRLLNVKHLSQRAETKFKETFGLSPRGVFFFRKDFLVRNFGDELSPVLVRYLLESTHRQRVQNLKPVAGKKLFAVGSILHFAKNGDVIWGSGVNGKVGVDMHRFRSLDVRAVRGPKTREFLAKRGIFCPEVFGDPALLLPQYIPKESILKGDMRDYIVIPNYNDLPLFTHEKHIVSPLQPLSRVLKAIVNSRLVVSSSLHGVVLAEAYGIPAVLLLPAGHGESIFKYKDYYLGTGRNQFPVAKTIAEARSIKPAPPPIFRSQALIDAFPIDFFYPVRGEL